MAGCLDHTGLISNQAMHPRIRNTCRCHAHVCHQYARAYGLPAHCTRTCVRAWLQLRPPCSDPLSLPNQQTSNLAPLNCVRNTNEASAHHTLPCSQNACVPLSMTLQPRVPSQGTNTNCCAQALQAYPHVPPTLPNSTQSAAPLHDKKRAGSPCSNPILCDAPPRLQLWSPSALPRAVHVGGPLLDVHAQCASDHNDQQCAHLPHADVKQDCQGSTDQRHDLWS